VAEDRRLVLGDEEARRRGDDMRIAAIGAGNIGGTLAGRWTAAGHEVVMGVRDPSSEKTAELAGRIGASVATPVDAVEGVDAVLLAVPGRAAADMLATVGPAIGSAVVIDAANNIGGARTDGLAAVRQHAPDAPYARAFNTLGWENFADPVIDGVALDLVWAGTDGPARATVEQLISDVGLRPLRLGDDDQVELVDAMLRVWFALVSDGRSRHIGFKLLGA
jgi:predicted dinucleotide-binding enzyme